MKLWEYVGKKIKVTFKDGQTMAGDATDYTSALDNTGETFEGEETICIGNIEFSAGEVANIEVLA